MIADAFKSWTSATTDATPTLFAGTLVSLGLETKTLLNISSASSTTNVLKLSPLHLFKQILNNALKRNAQTSGPNATPNAKMLLRSAKRNAVERSHAGLFVFQAREAKQQLTLPSALKPTTACLLSSLRKSPLHLFKQILNSALKKNALINGPNAMPNARLLSTNVKRNAVERYHAGLSAFLEREAKPPSMSQSVLKPTTACLLSSLRKFLMLLQILEILSNALKRSAPTSGQPARKTPSVFLLSRTVRRNAELRALAGPFASLQREAKPQSMLPSVPKPTNALVWSQPSSSAWLDLAPSNTQTVFPTGPAANPSSSAALLPPPTISTSSALQKNQRPKVASSPNGTNAPEDTSAYDPTWSTHIILIINHN